MGKANPWDKLSRKEFDTNVRESDIDPKAADNILIAWPPIIKLITGKFPEPAGVRLLDFGCGTGGFCKKMKILGFDVTGIDTSTGMIEQAKSHSPDVIHYLASESNSLKNSQKFQIIVSIMTFPFIKSVDREIINLRDTLDEGGLLIMADFNRSWVKACLKKGVSFADFDSTEKPNKGMMAIGNLKIPVYIRDTEYYDSLTRHIGLEKIAEVKPPFSREFKKNYPDNRPKSVPEYLILGYRKES